MYTEIIHYLHDVENVKHWFTSKHQTKTERNVYILHRLFNFKSKTHYLYGVNNVKNWLHTYLYEK